MKRRQRQAPATTKKIKDRSFLLRRNDNNQAFRYQCPGVWMLSSQKSKPPD